MRQGDEGLKEFTTRIRELFKLPAEVDISLTFGCKEPMSGHHLKLEGMGAFDAAVHCASVAAAERVHKANQRSSRDPATGAPHEGPESSDEGEDTTDLLQSTLGGPIQRPPARAAAAAAQQPAPAATAVSPAAALLSSAQSMPTLPAAGAGALPTARALSAVTTHGVPTTPRAGHAQQQQQPQPAGGAASSLLGPVPSLAAATAAAAQAMRQACGFTGAAAGATRQQRSNAHLGSSHTEATSALTASGASPHSHVLRTLDLAAPPTHGHHHHLGAAHSGAQHLSFPAAAATQLHHAGGYAAHHAASAAPWTPLSSSHAFCPAHAHDAGSPALPSAWHHAPYAHPLVPPPIDPVVAALFSNDEDEEDGSSDHSLTPSHHHHSGYHSAGGLSADEALHAAQRTSSVVAAALEEEDGGRDAEMAAPRRAAHRRNGSGAAMDVDGEDGAQQQQQAGLGACGGAATAAAYMHGGGVHLGSSSKQPAPAAGGESLEGEAAAGGAAAGQLNYDVPPHVISRSKLTQVLSFFGIRPPVQFTLGSSVQMDE